MMPFNFGDQASMGGNALAAHGEQGPELPEITTAEVGFKGLDRDCRIRFLPTPWPAESQPPPTSSLITTASRKGLVVGGAPDGLVVATTKSIRDALLATGPEGEKVKPFEPQARIPLPSRPTHVTFCSAENALAVATESGGQLLIYDSSALLQPNVQPSISIPTNGASLRALAGNPAPESEALSSFVAMVTSDGDLLLANLKAGSMVSGASGSVLKNGVSCVAWSAKGKQLVAGLADGTCYQLDPQGVKKADIPRPPELEGNKHVSSISWLETNLFLAVYTPNDPEDDMGLVPPSDYYIIERRAQSPFLFRTLPELCPPFGARRSPAYQFTLRLKDYDPDLTDAIIVSSTASTDIGLITRSKRPLGADGSANVFAKTTFTDEIRAATLPMSESGEELSTIGFALDLSSTEKVISPIPGEDIMESSTPLPSLILLTNEGFLLSWWFVHSEAIRQNKPYGALVAMLQNQPNLQPAPPQPVAQANPSPQQPAFGQTGFGQNQAIGGSLSTPAFGKPSFGSPSILGGGGRGGSAFGTTNTLGASPTAFGSTSALGSHGPQFGKSGFASMAGASSSGFGQPSALGQGFSSFASPASGATSTSTGFAGGGGFSAFAGSGGFASAASKVEGGESPFGKAAESSSPFGKPADGGSPFSKLGQQTTSSFGAPSNSTSVFGAPSKPTETSSGTFGLGSGGFQLGTSFKRDEKAADDNSVPEKSGGAFSLSSTFGNMLSDSPTQQTPPTEDMDDMEDEPAAPPSPKNPFGTSKATSLFGSPQTPQTAPPPTSGPLWGTQSQLTKTPAATQNSKPSSLFGTGPTEKTPSPFSPLSETTIRAQTPVEKQTEAPLPPDATSKTTYGPGDTSASSSNVSKSSVEDAPLPPDPIKFKKLEASSRPEEAPLPPDFLAKPKTRPSKLPSTEDAPLPPDFIPKPKAADSGKKAVDDAPLPPDFLSQAKKSEVNREQSPPLFSTQEPKDTTTATIKQEPDDEEPLPLDSVAPPHSATENEEDVALPEESDGSDGDFEDSGEEITNDISSAGDHDETEKSFKISPESSFGGTPDKAPPAGGAFTKISAPNNQHLQSRGVRPLFGEIPKPVLAPTQPRSPRSPSPVRPGTRKDWPRSETSRSISAPGGPGGFLSARKTTPAIPSFLQREVTVSDQREAKKDAPAQPQTFIEETQTLSDDDEEKQLRGELARPISPIPTLDPFVSHEGYTGPSFKPGIPGQIERLYRDINSMVDTLGINSRSISGYLLYQETSADSNKKNWAEVLQSNQPSNILDETLMLSQISDLASSVDSLAQTLEQHRVQRVQDKLDQCQQLLNRDVLTLRGQCSSIQKTLDAYTDPTAVQVAPLSAEQANLQQELRKSSSAIQSKVAELEEALSLLRAKLADSVGSDASVNGNAGRRQSSKKPTVEAVITTIATLMSMAESRSSDVDVLEAQMKKLGLDISGPSGSREGSPLTTPLKKSTIGRFPATPGSRGSREDGPRSAYHTPESTSKHRASIHEPTRMRMSRNLVDSAELELVASPDGGRWRERTKRRKEILSNLKVAVGSRKVKVRGMDDL